MRADQVETAAGWRADTCNLAAIVDRKRPRQFQASMTRTNEFI